MFRSPTTPSPSASPDLCHHSSLFRLPSDKSLPSARTAPADPTNFRSFILATRHSTLVYLEGSGRAAIAFRIRTCGKCASNPFRIRTSKTQDLKPLRMRTYEKTGDGVGPVGQPLLAVLLQFCQPWNTDARHGARISDHEPQAASHESRVTEHGSLT
jgi:hypothetical protein